MHEIVKVVKGFDPGVAAPLLLASSYQRDRKAPLLYKLSQIGWSEAQRFGIRTGVKLPSFSYKSEENGIIWLPHSFGSPARRNIAQDSKGNRRLKTFIKCGGGVSGVSRKEVSK